MDFGGGDEIRFERLGKAGVVTLTRPQALNALTHRMIKALDKALNAFEHDAGVDVVVVKAEGRAFSAGGDIIHFYEARAGKPPVEFFADEYRLNARINSFKKPYVALVDGIVMGGGVGISFHGSHRVLTENAQFAMPEVGIGFFPDVGGSHILPPLGSFGMYLALTGNRIGPGDALGSGLATHTIKATDQAALIERLVQGGDPDAALGDYSAPVVRETDAPTLASIGRHFSLPSLEAIVSSLAEAVLVEEFAAKTLATMRSRSPTSMAVAFRQIETGRNLSMAECMNMEFRVLNRMLLGHDFYEGIRAAIVDKDRQPRWRPAELEAVNAADIDAYFAPLGSAELGL
jgi:enoyl-CoA hydratase/carnithine racemase